MDFKDIQLDFKYLNDVATAIEFNEHIVDYYAVLLAELVENKRQVAPAAEQPSTALEAPPPPDFEDDFVLATPEQVAEFRVLQSMGYERRSTKQDERLKQILQDYENRIDRREHYEQKKMLLAHRGRYGQAVHKMDFDLNKEQKVVFRKAESMGTCNKRWYLDVYEKSGVLDFKKTNLCKDKFCNNCKRVMQATRMDRFIPEIDKFRDAKKIHLVLTSPNVERHNLKENIKQQFNAFAKLIGYLKAKKPIKGLDIHKWGYMGAVRSLEVTYKGDSYHPHLHVLLMFEDDFDIGPKTVVNAFSKKFGDVKRKFSEREILVQKIWYLLMNNERVNKKNIDSLQRGYSCMMDEFRDGDYHELFKYMTKGNGSPHPDTDAYMTYDNFKTLYYALLSVRQIQGYGVLFGIQEVEIDDRFDEVYADMVSWLRQQEGLQDGENPETVWKTVRGLIDDIGEYRVISRKRVYKYLRQLYHE
ncbi:protein rep [Paenibacillus sp. y28]|uniref:protein rep n=1 Tax=Paenibacillus sp. y28 TaxID=3129110 RepID=UPI003018F035